MHSAYAALGRHQRIEAVPSALRPIRDNDPLPMITSGFFFTRYQVWVEPRQLGVQEEAVLDGLDVGDGPKAADRWPRSYSRAYISSGHP